MRQRSLLVLSLSIALVSGANPAVAQPASDEAEAAPVRFFAGASAFGSVRSLPGVAVGAEGDVRLAIADFLWVGLAAGFSAAPGFHAERDASCCDMINSAEGDAFAMEGTLGVGFRGRLTDELTVGVLTGLGVAAVYGSGTLLGGFAGSQDFSEWWAIVEIPVELEFIWTVADVGIMVGAGPTFVVADDDLIEDFDAQERPHVGGRVRVGVLFGP